MGKLCVAPGCRSGYRLTKSEKKDPPPAKRRFHMFPKNKERRSLWIKALSYNNWEPSKYSALCDLHFLSSDYKLQSEDTNKYRSTDISIKILSKDAIPTQFPNMPSYFSKPAKIVRSKASLTSTRILKEKENIMNKIHACEMADTISSISELNLKLDRARLPDGIYERFDSIDQALIFHNLQFSDSHGFFVGFCAKVNLDLSIRMWYRNKELSFQILNQIIDNNHINKCDILLNILAYLNSLSTSDFVSENSTETNVEDEIESVIKRLQCLNPHLDEHQEKKLSFLTEQLSLLIKAPSQRRYTTLVYALSLSWKSFSTALYRELLKEVLTLPTIRRLSELSTSLNLETGLSNTTVKYLKTRLDSFENHQEKSISIVFDETYCTGGVDYFSGSFFGLREGEHISKTIFCVLIKSLHSTHNEIAIHPISKLNAEIVKKNVFDQVAQVVSQIGFKVRATICDAHTINQKMYSSDLCHRNLRPYIFNPNSPKSKIYLLFDSVDVMKNFFNNFLSRTHFVCPNFRGKLMEGKVSHIVDLYNLELGDPLKIAHKLTERVLEPLSIEKMNVKLTDSLFHESTIAALRHYGERNDKKDWLVTADLLEVFWTWWMIVNTRSPRIGSYKINESKKSLLHFLKDFSCWLDEWERLGDEATSLTKDTFLAAKQTSTGLYMMSQELLDEVDVNHV